MDSQSRKRLNIAVSVGIGDGTGVSGLLGLLGTILKVPTANILERLKESTTAVYTSPGSLQPTIGEKHIARTHVLLGFVTWRFCFHCHTVLVSRRRNYFESVSKTCFRPPESNCQAFGGIFICDETAVFLVYAD